MKRALPLVLLGAVVLLICLGVAALAANFVLSKGDAVDLSQWKTTVSQVDTNKIAPAVALETLGGTGSQQAVDDALQQGNWETAFAGLAYASDIDDADRAGTLLLLGSRYAAAKETNQAAWAYQYAATLVTISPVPSDLVRGQTLVEAARGLSSLQATSAARAALDQAYLIAEYSPTIPRDLRARLYGQISQAYNDLGVTALGAVAHQRADEAAAQTSEDASVATRPPYKVQAAEWKATSDVQDKTRARVDAAKQLIDEVALHPPKSEKDVPAELVGQLGDALTQEDAALQSYYDSLQNGSPDTAAQASLLQDQVRWLSLKLRVARRAFGLSLVPEWETDAPNIAQALSDAQDQYFKLSEQQAAAADDPSAADRNMEDVLRAELAAGRWGLYQYDEQDLISRLNEISAKLRDAQVPTLRLDSFERNKSVLFLLVPDDLYGQGEQALPK